MSTFNILFSVLCWHSGDYQTRFDDLDSSDDDGRRKSLSDKNKPKARTKECPGCGAFLPLATRDCSYCDYQFTSKSMLVPVQSAVEESQSIRERFPFEPERVY